MGQLLFDEAPLVINKTLATKIGLNEAIVLQQIHYWLQINEKNCVNKEDDKHYKDGCFWTYNSIKKWSETFPFFSASTLRRTFTRLEELKIVKVANYNDSKIDRTKWYTIDYKVLYEYTKEDEEIGQDMKNAFAQNEQMEESKMSKCKCSELTNGITQNEQTNTKDYSEITTEITAEITDNKNIQSEIVCATSEAPTDIDLIIERWNSNKYLAKITKLTSDTNRYKMLKARMKDYSLDDILKAIDNISKSDWLQGKTIGRNGNPFILTFDWFVRPNNFPKIFEGYYTNKEFRTVTVEQETGGNAFDRLRAKYGGDSNDNQHT